MSQAKSYPVTWCQSLNRWFNGTSARKRIEQPEPPAPAHVEYLEIRQLLSATNAATSEQTAANSASSDEQTANEAGSSSTTTTTYGVDANGNATTTTTVTTTVTDADGNTTTSTTSTTTVDGDDDDTDSDSINSDLAIATAVQTDGKIVLVGGAQMNTYGNYDFAVTRLNSDGTLDTTFGDNGKMTIAFDLGGTDEDGNLNADLDIATCVAIQTDGKIVVGGYAQRDSNGNFDFAVVRLNSDGTMDTSFSSDGKALVAFDYGGAGDDRATGVAIQADGRIVLVGTCQQDATGNGDIAMARLLSDGSLDTSFTGDGRKWIDLSEGGDDGGAAVAIQSDGSILVAGYTTSASGDSDFAIARVTPDGSLDYSFSDDGKKTIAFNIGGTATDRATSIVIQADGSIVVAGSASGKNGDGDFAVARITSKGGMDGSFSGDGRKTVAFNLGAHNEDGATGVAVQADGSIVIGGYSQVSSSGDYDFSLARLTSEGDLDLLFAIEGKKTVPFNTGGSDYDMANGMVMQSDGKLVIFGGGVKADPADTDFGVVRLDSDGGLDTGFGSGGKKTVAFDLTTT